jgi:signal transduction histidine kinase
VAINISGHSALMLPWLLAGVMLSFLVVGRHAVRLLLRGSAEQRILASAYLLHGGANSLTILMNYGLLPANLFTMYVAQGAQAVHVLGLHIGLYRKFKHYQAQAQAAQYDNALLKERMENEQQQRRNQQRLLRMVDHEIRTPIAIINASTRSLALMDDSGNRDGDGRRSRRYDKIYRAVKRLELLVQITKAGVRDDWANSQPEEMDPVWAVEALLTQFQTAGRPIDLRLDQQPIGRICFDAAHFDFVLTNLLDNALKYSPKGVAYRVEHPPPRRPGRARRRHPDLQPDSAAHERTG